MKCLTTAAEAHTGQEPGDVLEALEGPSPGLQAGGFRKQVYPTPLEGGAGSSGWGTEN
jgi:hypothetical protein